MSSITTSLLLQRVRRSFALTASSINSAVASRFDLLCQHFVPRQRVTGVDFPTLILIAFRLRVIIDKIVTVPLTIVNMPQPAVTVPSILLEEFVQF